MARIDPPPAPTVTFQECIRKSHYLLPIFLGSFHLLLKLGNTLQLVQNRVSLLIRHVARNRRQAGKKCQPVVLPPKGQNQRGGSRGNRWTPPVKTLFSLSPLAQITPQITGASKAPRNAAGGFALLKRYHLIHFSPMSSGGYYRGFFWRARFQAPGD